MFDILTTLFSNIPIISAGAKAAKAVTETGTSSYSNALGSNVVIQLMMISLIIFSIACWAIILFKLVLIKRAKKETKLFLEIFWTSKNLDEIYGSSDNLISSPVAGVFKSGFAELEKLQKTSSQRREREQNKKKTKKATKDLTHMSTELEGAENIARSLKNAQNTECVYLEKYLPFLATTGSTAPFIGLFGTVWGLMDAFKAIGLKGSSNLAVVAPGISGALTTTAAGLAAAIPAVLAYNYFFNEVRLLETEMENFSFEFLNIIDRHLLTYENDDDSID
ncbi:MotA/TolQ/ExbB proton channel family protein [Thermodesulfobacteriota bacterium]